MCLLFKAFSMYNLVALAWNMPRPVGEKLIKEYNCDRIKGRSQGRRGGRKPMKDELVNAMEALRGNLGDKEFVVYELPVVLRVI